MNRNRTAGIRAEQKIVRELKDLGFDNVVTTRAESKNMDDKGVDIIQTPGFTVELPCYLQIKKSINTPNLEDCIVILDKPMAVIHVKVKKKNTRFFEVGEYVYMTKDFFYKLLNDAYINIQRTESPKD